MSNFILMNCTSVAKFKMVMNRLLTGFTELGRIAASNFTFNSLQTMALQLVCGFLDRYVTDSDSASQHLQYTGGPGGTGKSRVIDALKWVFSARGQSHLLQITGTSGSAAAQIGGTTLHSACGLDTNRSSQTQLPVFSETKKSTWKQKLVLVTDEVSMLGGATLYEVSRNLQSLRDCADKPFGGIPVMLLMGDFYQLAPGQETSLLLGFEIAVICALTIEADAVEALLDQYWDEEEHSFGKAPGDPNAYSTGSIGRHNVVLAHMPIIGKVSSAAVAAQ
jgi:hypothetical protein